jgi:glycosyltransferase involved in cell wall biosynthesis
MRISFIDPSGLDYHLATPLKRGLGGSQSALCFLAAALARRHHDVAVVNGISKPREDEGVRFLPVQTASGELVNRADVVIVQNGAIGETLRERFAVRKPKVLWSEIDINQPAIQDLRFARERDSWTGFAFVSHWQATRYHAANLASPVLSAVFPNGVAPPFLELPADEAGFTTAKPPILAYTSTPYRGLDVLLDAFPLIRAAWPSVRLKVYSGMAVYQITGAADPCRELYRRCAATAGVEYIGPMGQARLARELAHAAALAYPSTFAETFCTAAIEAASAGAALFLTRLGALPEINAGFADFTDAVPDKGALARDFAELVIRGLQAMAADPPVAAAKRRERIAAYRARFCWDSIAQQWETWLKKILNTQ